MGAPRISALDHLIPCESCGIRPSVYLQQSRDDMEVVFTLLAERYERGSVLMTSNLLVGKRMMGDRRVLARSSVVTPRLEDSTKTTTLTQNAAFLIAAGANEIRVLTHEIPTAPAMVHQITLR